MNSGRKIHPHLDARCPDYAKDFSYGGGKMLPDKIVLSQVEGVRQKHTCECKKTKTVEFREIGPLLTGNVNNADLWDRYFH